MDQRQIYMVPDRRYDKGRKVIRVNNMVSAHVGDVDNFSFKSLIKDIGKLAVQPIKTAVSSITGKKDNTVYETKLGKAVAKVNTTVDRTINTAAKSFADTISGGLATKGVNLIRKGENKETAYKYNEMPKGLLGNIAKGVGTVGGGYALASGATKLVKAVTPKISPLKMSVPGSSGDDAIKTALDGSGSMGQNIIDAANSITPERQQQMMDAGSFNTLLSDAQQKLSDLTSTAGLLPKTAELKRAETLLTQPSASTVSALSFNNPVILTILASVVAGLIIFLITKK